MANGDMIAELRKLAESDGKISTPAALRMTLSALAQQHDTLLKIQADQECVNDNREAQDREITALKNDMEKIKKQVEQIEGLSESLERLTGEIQKLANVLTNNPVVSIGQFIRDHPRLAAAGLAILLILANVWFIEAFRIGILEWLGVPDSIIDLVTSTPSTPPPVPFP